MIVCFLIISGKRFVFSKYLTVLIEIKGLLLNKQTFFVFLLVSKNILFTNNLNKYRLIFLLFIFIFSNVHFLIIYVSGSSLWIYIKNIKKFQSLYYLFRLFTQVNFLVYFLLISKFSYTYMCKILLWFLSLKLVK